VKDDGFTLIEVLAALVIFSVGIAGLVQLNTQSIKTVSSLENKMLAGIVADNVIVEARAKKLRLGDRDGDEEAGGQTYEWEQSVIETEQEKFYRIVVTVKAENSDQVLVQRTAFRGPDK